MKNSGTIISALLIGAAVGAIIGVLLAPDKGSVSRKKLINRKKGYAHDYNLEDFYEHKLNWGLA
ncbi:MAG: YtxH domain-containing protein [Bacteroidetes bacterium]|nr:YtxH domain-containing protein [Bacteroidota bacterium]